MSSSKSKFCPAVWFSGFFALGALAHLIRLLSRLPVTLGTYHVPLLVSGILVLVFGGLSLTLLVIGIKRPCEKGESGPSCCQH